jgi:TonB family protein
MKKMRRSNEMVADYPRNARSPRRTQRMIRLAAAAALLLFLPGLVLPAAAGPAAAGPAAARANDRGGEKRQLINEQNGNLTIRDGGHVRVDMDMGDVHILTGAGGGVIYRLRVEGSASEAARANGKSPFVLSAQSISDGVTLSGRMISEHHSGRLWVSLEVTLPKNSPLDANTQGGNVEVANLDARLRVDTGGGNVTVGRVGGDARLESGGGHITVQDVSGELTASTGGGHILAGRIHGDATLRTGGGHIRVAAVDGAARLDTGGGNIFLQQAGARLTVTTGGGRIVVGEAPGGMQARTGGGGIRILRVAGPTELETGAGAIFLSRVQGSVHASTGSGVITAWLAAPVIAGQSSQGKAAPGKGTVNPKASVRPVETGSDLESGNGDIVVYLPRDLGVNIEALLENSDSYRIDVDPPLALKVVSGLPGHGGALRAEGTINGGGPRVRLKAESGNIRLRVADAPEPPLPFDPAKFDSDLDKSFSQLEKMLEDESQSIDRYCDTQQRKYEMELQMKRHSEDLERHAKEMAEHGREMQQQMDDWRKKTEGTWTDRTVVSADVLKQKLVHKVEPVYPDRARRQQLEGTVRLRVAVDAEGKVEDVKVLSGSSLFSQAAADAVRQWHYEPIVVEGKAVPVVSEVTVVFRLP